MHGTRIWMAGSVMGLGMAVAAAAQDASPAETNQGLRAWHYGGSEIKGQPHRTVIQSPNFKLTPKDKGFLYFSATRFAGSLVAPDSGEYVFRVDADNGARLVLDGKLLTDSWKLKGGNTLDSTPTRLEAGRSYGLLIDFVQDLGDASLHLQWKRPGREFELIADDYLRPDPPDAPLTVTRIRFRPAPGRAKDMVGGKFSGSVAAPTVDLTTLAAIAQAPAEGQWTELSIPNQGVFRYLKYDGPKGSYAAIAEVEFCHGQVQLKGVPFGTNGSRDDSGNTFEKALDGDPATSFEGNDRDSSYVGIDLGEAAVTPPPVFDPAPGNFPGKDLFVTIRSPTPGACTLYTLDGSVPLIGTGTLCTEPIALAKTATIQARSFGAGRADSVAVMSTYTLAAKPMVKGLRTFHTGNSLLAGVNQFLVPIAQSAGFDHFKSGAGCAGAPTDWIYSQMSNEWMKVLAKDSPFDAVITQPFEGHGRSIANETEFSGKLYEALRAQSPDVRLFLYMQWPMLGVRGSWGKGILPLGNKQADFTDQKLTQEDHWAPFDLQPGEEIKPIRSVPGQAAWDRCRALIRPEAVTTNWEVAVRNYERYFEVLRGQLAAKYPQKPVCIIPVGTVLLRIKQDVAAGKFPGFARDTDFFASFFSDDIHQNDRGRYVGALTHFACLYQADPVGKVTSAGSGFSEEQATYVQRLVWDVVKGYEGSGLAAAATM